MDEVAHSPQPTSGIRSLGLRTAAPLGEMRRFYTGVLGLDTKLNSATESAGDTDSLTISAGTTRLSFRPQAAASESSIYHFAFNISENMLTAARQWLASRVALTPTDAGMPVHAFPRWNAHAIYFDDPAGNILEFIARHALPSARSGGFTPADILYVSEIGIVVDDVPAAVREIGGALGLAPFRGLQGEEFTAVGGEDQLLILARRGRTWHAGGGRTAEVFETLVELSGAPAGRYAPPGLPYDIRR